MLPFVLGSVVLHVGLIAFVPAWSDHGPHVALASQTRAVRLVLPPMPREPEPQPQPEPIPEAPEPVPEPAPVEPPPVVPQFEPPPPIPDAPVIPEPPPVEPRVETQLEAEPPPIPEPIPETIPEPIPEPTPEPIPEPVPEPEVIPPVEPPPEPPPEDLPPQPGDAEVDEAALEVQAVPDPAFAPRPKYPRKARVRKWQGTVWLEVDVDATGRPTRVSLHKSSGHGILDDAAIATVRTWKFKPGQRGGESAATTVRVPVTFRLVDR